MLLRSRGGKNLDYEGETYHLIHLCSRCHGQAHSDYESGLIIEGSVQWDHLLGRPVYTGPDEYLSKHYPQSSSDGEAKPSSKRC
jgi:hypothetical protein